MARRYGCHVVTYCIAQSIGQAVWLPCGYLLHCTEYWPGGMVAMWLLTSMHRVLARRYGCHVVTYCIAQSTGQAVWLPCDYCSSQSIGQAVWLPWDYPYCNAEYWTGNMVAMWLLTAMYRVLVRQYSCHVITYCISQSIGQAVWLPCDYLLHFTEFWPGGMVAMWLLTALHRVLARQYSCHVITYWISQSIGQAVWLPCDYLLHFTEFWPGGMVAMWLLTAMHWVLARQYCCHVITYCSAHSTGQAVWLPWDYPYCNAQSIGQAVWLPCDYLLQWTEYWPGGMVVMRLLQCTEYWPSGMIAILWSFVFSKY